MKLGNTLFFSLFLGFSPFLLVGEETSEANSEVEIEIEIDVDVDGELEVDVEEVEFLVQGVPEPWGFGGIYLKASMESVESLLDSSAFFVYNSQRVSWLPFSPLISADGRGFIKKGYFQFVEDQLYSITLIMDEGKIDYFTLFTQFNEKYGNYTLLSPSNVKWVGLQSELTLEKPLTVKYLDMELHRAYVAASQVEKSKQQARRENFLDQF